MKAPFAELDMLDARVEVTRSAVRMAEDLAFDHSGEPMEQPVRVLACAMHHLLNDMESLLGMLRRKLWEAAQ